MITYLLSTNQEHCKFLKAIDVLAKEWMRETEQIATRKGFDGAQHYSLFAEPNEFWLTTKSSGQAPSIAGFKGGKRENGRFVYSIHKGQNKSLAEEAKQLYKKWKTRLKGELGVGPGRREVIFCDKFAISAMYVTGNKLHRTQVYSLNTGHILIAISCLGLKDVDMTEWKELTASEAHRMIDKHNEAVDK